MGQWGVGMLINGDEMCVQMDERAYIRAYVCLYICMYVQICFMYVWFYISAVRFHLMLKNVVNNFQFSWLRLRYNKNIGRLFGVNVTVKSANVTFSLSM